MKRRSIFGVGLVAVVVLALFFVGVLIAQQDSVKSQARQNVQTESKVRSQQTTRALNFIDENGNGICDRFEQMQRIGPGANGRGRNFVDEDGDGICDHRGVNGMGMYHKHHRGGRFHQNHNWRNR